MAWNVAMMFVKAPKEELENIVPDIFTKKTEDNFFEDATSVMLQKDMDVSYHDEWVILTDVEGRIIFNDLIPKEISKHFSVKTFWIAENLKFRQYENCTLTKEVSGINEGEKYLLDNGIKPIDEWGETIIIQILGMEAVKLDDLYALKFDIWGI